MAEDAITRSGTEADALAPPPDEQNPALIDAEKTFKITLISAILFCLAAAAIVLRTRMG